MANKSLFQTIKGKLLPKADAVNSEGAKAYAFTAEHALAQYAMTGCMNSTFYASAEDQLSEVLALCEQVDPAFIAKLAVYARRDGYMKDLPALLCAVLSVRGSDLLPAVFHQVIDDGKMLRNFVQILRSGVVGRKSLGTRPKRLVLEWFSKRSDEQIFKSSVGNAPSLADVIKMVHPKPSTKSRDALFGYLIGKPYQAEDICALVRDFERFKLDPKAQTPDVPFQMLTGLELDKAHWVDIARNASWQMTRMNLNTFQRHGVFELPELVKIVAERLKSAELIAKAKVFPYQLLAAYKNANEELPFEIRDALQGALELATANVPKIDGQVVVLPDVSGSMQSPVTGFRAGSTTKVQCIDVAALVAATLLRLNPSARVLPFENDVVSLRLNPRDSVMTNAHKLRSIGGGGTNCSAPLRKLNSEKAKVDLVIYVSDNESWLDKARGPSATATIEAWAELKQRNPHARLVCLDVTPNRTTQAGNAQDVLNIGGFSDQVFPLIASFARGEMAGDQWVKSISDVKIAA